MRLHGVSQADVGFVAAPIGLGGVVGSLLAKRSKSEAAPLLVPVVVSLFAVVGTLGFLMAPTVPLAVIGGTLGAFAIAVHTGP